MQCLYHIYRHESPSSALGCKIIQKLFCRIHTLDIRFTVHAYHSNCIKRPVRVEPALPYSCHGSAINFHPVVTVGSQFDLVRGGDSSARSSSISRASGSGSDHRHQHYLWPNLYHSPTHGPHCSLRGLHMPLTLTWPPRQQSWKIHHIINQQHWADISTWTSGFIATLRQ